MVQQTAEIIRHTFFNKGIPQHLIRKFRHLTEQLAEYANMTMQSIMKQIDNLETLQEMVPPRNSQTCFAGYKSPVPTPEMAESRLDLDKAMRRLTGYLRPTFQRYLQVFLTDLEHLISFLSQLEPIVVFNHIRQPIRTLIERLLRQTLFTDHLEERLLTLRIQLQDLLAKNYLPLAQTSNRCEQTQPPSPSVSPNHTQSPRREAIVCSNPAELQLLIERISSGQIKVVAVVIP